MKTIWDTAMHILGTMPWWLAAFLVGWVASVGITHPLKVGLRRYTHTDPDNRHLIAWLTAALSALAFAWAFAVEQGASVGAAGMVAVLTGFWSPLAFAGLQRFLRASPRIGQAKGFGWVPDLSGVADWLSGDVGPAKGQGDDR